MKIGFGLGLTFPLQLSVQGPFLPDKLVGLAIWLDADDVNTIMDSGSPDFEVSQWNDKSFNGNHVTQTTVVNQPKRTGLTTINGKSTVDFDGVNDYLIGPFAIEMIPLSNHTIFFVAHLDAVTALDCFLSWNGNGSGNRELFCFSSGNFVTAGDLGSLTLINDDLRTVDVLVSVIVDHGNTITTRRDGVEETSFSIPAITDTDSFLISAERDSPTNTGNFTDIHVGEIIFYNRELAIEEINQVEVYLADKWGFNISFPIVFSVDFSSDFS